MTTAPEFIESIVREVMRRLNVERESVDSPPIETDALKLDDRVITLATLSGRLSGIRRIVTRPCAVITPAARDLLKEHSISVEKCGKAQQTTGKKMVIGSTKSCVVSLPWQDIKCAAGWTFEAVTRSSAASLAKYIAEGLPVSFQLALVVTERPFEFLCLANRHPTVRAVLGLDNEMIRTATTQIDANVLVTGDDQLSDALLIQFMECSARHSGEPSHSQR